MNAEKALENNSWTEQDNIVRQRLNNLSVHDSEFWSFRENDRREHVHAYFQYPAMMVPQMQAALIEAVMGTSATISNVFDPFMGSGTVLGEAMRLGLNFGGCDINPLALLICKSKTNPLDVCKARGKSASLLERISSSLCNDVEVHFPNREKWFRPDVAIGLSKIRSAIQREEDPNFRRFFWVMLAETIRLTSNSRTDTVKLYARPEKETAERCIKPIASFTSILERNLNNMLVQRNALLTSQLLDGNNYKGELHLHHGDTRLLSQDRVGKRAYDLLVTSPPYGDNGTTVTYGQHSYLPLQWIPLEDIEAGLDNNWLSSTHEIDAKSLGGSRKAAYGYAEDLKTKSSTLATLYEELIQGDQKDKEGASRVIAFCHDLDMCIDPILSILRPNAYLIITIGNRTVRGRVMQLDTIFADFMKCRHVVKVHQLPRSIANKRQASRNKKSVTMSKETILILRKGIEST